MQKIMTKEIINMEHTQNLFQEFDTITTEDWINAIERFLKGKPLESLNWKIEENLIISPVHRKATTTTQYIGTASLTANNNWNICEAFLITASSDYASINALILEALSKGVNALILDFQQHVPNKEALTTLLTDVLLDLVYIHFTGDALTTAPIQLLHNIANIPNASQLNGSCALGKLSIDALIRYFDFCSTTLPNLRFITIPVANASSNSLSQAIYTADYYLATLLDRGKNIEQITHFLRFDFNVGEHYFVELAAIRAFKRLWLGVLEAYEIPQASFPFFHASTLSDQNENQYWNMITATTQTMAAAIAGVDSIWVRPSNNLVQADDFTRRIARNVQHLLQAESYLNRVIDPAAGAYYIENLTAALAQKAWQQFCKL